MRIPYTNFKTRTGDDNAVGGCAFIGGEWKDVDTNTNQVLFFTSPSCGPCMKMKNTVWTNDQVKERISEYLDSPSMIDTSIKQNDDKFTQYKIKYLPTIIMIDDEGDEIRRNVGFMDVDELLNFLK